MLVAVVRVVVPPLPLLVPSSPSVVVLRKASDLTDVYLLRKEDKTSASLTVRCCDGVFNILMGGGAAAAQQEKKSSTEK